MPNYLEFAMKLIQSDTLFSCANPDSRFQNSYDPDKIYSRADSDSRILGQIWKQFIRFRVGILVFLCRSGSNLLVFGFGFSNSCADTDSIHSCADSNFRIRNKSKKALNKLVLDYSTLNTSADAPLKKQMKNSASDKTTKRFLSRVSFAKCTKF